MLVAQALAPTVRSGNSGLLGEFRIESLTCPSKPDTARPVPLMTQLTSTINWPRLLPPTEPSHSGVSYIERRSVSNPGSHHRESSALPTELRDGTGRETLHTTFTSKLPNRPGQIVYHLIRHDPKQRRFGSYFNGFNVRSYLLPNIYPAGGKGNLLPLPFFFSRIASKRLKSVT